MKKSEIAFGPAGHCDHWAFIAEGINEDDDDDRVYFVAQFYEGNNIPLITSAREVTVTTKFFQDW